MLKSRGGRHYPLTHRQTDRQRNARPSLNKRTPIRRNCGTPQRTNRRRKMRAQLRSNLEPRKVLGTRAVSRARAHPDHLEHFRVSLSPLEIIRRQVCLGVRPGCLERFRLFRGRLKSSRAARLSRAASGYLESTSGYLEPLEITWRQGCLGAGPGCLERFRLSRNRLELSRAARLSREGSGYLERSGYLEGGVGTTRASRWLGPLRMTRSAQDDSVRYETSHVLRHCKDW